MNKNIAVIGGGAAGLTAAISAARRGANVTIYERCDRVAKKILATGNGRCNMTNINADICRYHGKNPKFIMGAASRFWVNETLDFFSEIGLLSKIEENGKVYPYSLQAAAVSDALRFEAEHLGIKTFCKFEAEDISQSCEGYTLSFSNGEKASANRVILSAGGKASPKLGSNGSGYSLAKKLGHTVTPLFPSLVQIKTDNIYTKSLQGTKIIASASLYEKNQLKKISRGEVLFTEYGLSGPPVFDLSRLASVSENSQIRLDIMPEFSEEQICRMLSERKNNYKTLENYFIGMLPKKLGQVLLKACGIAPLSRICGTLSDKEISLLSKKIKSWDFSVRGTMSWDNAQVTAGGVNVSEVNPATMQSKIKDGLFFAGEILDIDGDCGGFNLQWAWSSGFIAGKNAAEF